MNLSICISACLLVFLQLMSTSYAHHCESIYCVKAGDTCYQISRANWCYLEDLIKANPGINCNNLQIGQQLCLPAKPVFPPHPVPQPIPIPFPHPPPPAPHPQPYQPQPFPHPVPLPFPPQPPSGTCVSVYIIKAGDICYNIAKNFGVQLYQLINYNPGIHCDNLQIGQPICVCRV